MATFLSAVYAIPHFIFKLIVRLKYAISKISNFGYFYLAQNELHIYVKICIFQSWKTVHLPTLTKIKKSQHEISHEMI